MIGSAARLDEQERRLVQAARQGELGAWAELVQRHQETVYRAALLVARRSEVAEEATREAFVRGWRALPSFDEGTSFRAWQLRIAMGLARTQRREQRRVAGLGIPTRGPSADPLGRGVAASAANGPSRSSRPAPDGDGSHGGMPDPGTVERDLMLAALDRLAEDDRILICGGPLLGLSEAEGAQLVGIGMTALEGQWAASMGRLRERIADGPINSAPGGLAPGQVDPRAALLALADGPLANLVATAAVGEAPWAPDVVTGVMQRVERDMLAYPERFGRTPGLAGPMASERGAALVSPVRRPRALVLMALVALAIAVVGLLIASRPAAGPAAGPASGQRSAQGLRLALRPVAEGLDTPVAAVGAGDGSGRLFVVEQVGRIRVIDADGALDPEPFVDLGSRVLTGGERGLLGLAFHPAFVENGRFFVDYTREPDGATVVSELRVREGTVDVTGERVLLVVEQPFANHNGGGLAFDVTGKLLIGLGDGGSGGDPLGSGQDRGSLLGKLLRIDVDAGDPYGIPEDNAFVDQPEVRPEIHALGLRNPWRFSVDRETGDIWIGDVGQGTWEEIDRLPGGRGGLDLGWNEVEGPACFREGCDLSAHELPVVAYSHEEGCSVVGGYVYRGVRQPKLAGTYLFGDYCEGTIWAVDAAGLIERSAVPEVAVRLDGPLVSFGEDDDAELYAVAHDGRVLHIEAEPVATGLWAGAAVTDARVTRA